MNTNKLPLVSILIPFYNHNHFIKQTLDSIKEDTYENKEIIIINDGSSNPEDSNITNWMQQHPEIQTTYIKRENRGVTKTLNELIRMANGDYILPCASDDYFIENTIAERIRLLQNNPNKKIVIGDTIVVNDNNKLLFKSNLFEMRKNNPKNFLTDYGIQKMIITKWGGLKWLADKSLFDTIGIFDENLIVEDWDFFLRVASKNLAIFYPDKKVSAYRLHDNNTITNHKKQLQMWQDLYRTAKKHIKSFKNPYLKYQLWRKSKHYLKALNQCR
jgi:glycosyltransferase domain-containing protein